MHEAFFFGPSDQQLFANYHPEVRGDGRALTVICPPLFSEGGFVRLKRLIGESFVRQEPTVVLFFLSIP